MRRRAIATLLGAATLAAALLGAPAAQGFGLKELDAGFTSLQAGSHPFAFDTDIAVETEAGPGGVQIPAGLARNLKISAPAGLVGAPTSTPRCSGADFDTIENTAGIPLPNCSNSSVVGLTRVKIRQCASCVLLEVGAPVYNLVPPPGVAAKFGFVPNGGAPVTFTAEVSETPPYNLIVRVPNITQQVLFYSSETEIWGNPSDPAHDSDRGVCGAFFNELEGFHTKGEIGGECPTSNPDTPFLTLPRSCSGPLGFLFEAESWTGQTSAPPPVTTHGSEGEPLGTFGCDKLGFSPQISVAPSTHSASSPSGLDVGVDVEDEGLTSPGLPAKSDIKRAEVIFPKGIAINPSQAEGLGVCSEADFAREHAGSAFGAGCPGSSKIGTVEVETPLLEGTILKGALFVAAPYENPFGSLIALYMTITEPQLGIGIKLAGKVSADPASGQLIGTFGEPGHELPQLPFSHFRLHFREGARSPLITPPACGTYAARAIFTPWANPDAPYEATPTFRIDSGPGGGPCPSGPAPFAPDFEAGSLSNQAGAYAPFYMRLARGDGEGDLTRFSAVLPPGVVGKIAGLQRCPEAGIARAEARTGPHGAAEELADPSCPAASAIGRTLAAAGVGSQLTYVPGKLYLAGPYNGDPLSVVAIVPAKAGPFDAGTVVVREALTLNPITAQAEVDGSASDPIPHILQGIPLNVREIEVFADRPEFTLNPTSCAEERTAATAWGGGTALSPTGESPVALFARYQAAGCASLGFAPKLGITLRGGTKRGRFPALKAVVTPRPGDANFQRAVVTLPHSAFLEQGHFGTICTRVQFAAPPGDGAQCPPASIYGKARAWTPLLAEPAEGPVYLRSSNHNLPDLVVALKGPPSAPFEVQLASRIDSKEGGIRSSFEAIPDIPVSRFILEMQGGKKGLIVNSTNICRGKHRAQAKISAQNGRVEQTRPPVRALGCSKSHGRRHRRSSHQRRRA